MDRQIVEFVTQKKKTVVVIYRNESISGHGVLISNDGLIGTVYHLFHCRSSKHGRRKHKCDFEVGSEVELKLGDGDGAQRYIAKILVLEPLCDIALLRIVRLKTGKVNAWNFDYDKFASGEVELGQDLHMVVTCYGEHYEYSTGIVAYEKRIKRDIKDKLDLTKFIDDNLSYIQVHDMHAVGGYSGAPVYDSRGFIIGIWSSSHTRMGLVVPISYLEQICKDKEEAIFGARDEGI